MKYLKRLTPPLGTMIDAWSGDYSIRGDESEADCVIGFSFGYRGKRRDITPGLSNQDLANVALKYYADLPKILQFEIADAYAEAKGKNAKSIVRIERHRTPNKYLDTREVAVQAKQIMDLRGFKKAILLAHPYHLPRVQAVCEALKIDWICGSEERGAIEFDPLSSQQWTRDLDHWRGYEPFALMYYRIKGWL